MTTLRTQYALIMRFVRILQNDMQELQPDKSDRRHPVFHAALLTPANVPLYCIEYKHITSQLGNC